MKKPNIVVVALLISAVFLGAISSSAKNDEKKSFPIDTLCCKDGLLVGSANNCAVGAGSCTDTTCPPGTSEKETRCDSF